MLKVHSLSGGKTSSYMALHYPADYNVFALVTINDRNCSPKDKYLIDYVSKKIGKEFIATVEDDSTIVAMMDLEQMLGREIIWVVGKTFDDVIDRQGILASKLRRYCTRELKLRPIFDWWFKNIGEKIKMGIGYRWDEIERANKFTKSFVGIVGKRKSQNKWENVEWREGWFPLIEDHIIYPTILEWAKKSGIYFPLDSNCVGCFHKSYQQLRKNWEDNPQKMNWFSQKEKIGKGTWRQQGSYDSFRKIPIQMDFFYGGGSGCDGGFCTD